MQPGRPKSIQGTFAAEVRAINPAATKTDIDKLRKQKLDEQKWTIEPQMYNIEINTEELTRYFELCEDISNKSAGVKFLDKALENNGEVTIQYKCKYNIGRRYGLGPSPEKVDSGSRAVAMHETGMLDADQVNSILAIICFLARVLAMPFAIISAIA